MPGQASGRGQTQEISHFYKRADSFISWRLMPAKTQSVKKPLFYQIGELLLWNLVIPQDTQLGYCDREYYPSGAITLTKAGARVLFHDVARRSEAGAASARSGENILSDGIAGKTYASYQPVLTTYVGLPVTRRRRRRSRSRRPIRPGPGRVSQGENCAPRRNPRLRDRAV
jgi:hypothetical protein